MTKEQIQLNMTRLALARKVRRAALGSRSIRDVAKEVLVLAWAIRSLPKTRKESSIASYSKFSTYLCYTGSTFDTGKSFPSLSLYSCSKFIPAFVGVGGNSDMNDTSQFPSEQNGTYLPCSFKA
jgi:hypothetical protein